MITTKNTTFEEMVEMWKVGFSAKGEVDPKINCDLQDWFSGSGDKLSLLSYYYANQVLFREIYLSVYSVKDWDAYLLFLIPYLRDLRQLEERCDLVVDQKSELNVLYDVAEEDIKRLTREVKGLEEQLELAKGYVDEYKMKSRELDSSIVRLNGIMEDQEQRILGLKAKLYDKFVEEKL